MFVGVPYTEESVKDFLFNVPLGRLTQPSDVANYCLFLASDEAKFITGTCLEVDGGRGIQLAYEKPFWAGSWEKFAKLTLRYDLLKAGHECQTACN